MHRLLFAAVLLTLGISIVARAEAQPTATIRVGRNVHVSTARKDVAHLESIMAADPVLPGRLMASSHIHYADSGSITSIVYTSFDAGKTWDMSLDPRDTLSAGVDPALAYGPDGNAFFATLGKYTLWRSRDGGRTWEKPTKIPQFIGLDREYLVADFGKDSKYRGRVYMNGTIYPAPLDTGRGTSALGIYTSLDGGTNYGNPIFKQVNLPRWILGMANSVVLSDGMLVTLFGIMHDINNAGRDEMDRASATLNVGISKDGGETIAEKVQVSDYWMNRPRSEGAVIPWLAVDPGSTDFKDRLYVVWSDFRSRRLEIMLSYSSDKGKSWSPPVIVNDDRTPMDPSKGPDAIVPVVAVNKDGVVAVSWYDRRESADNLGWYVRVSASLDGGDTWSPSMRVSEAATRFDDNVRAWNISGGANISGDTAKSGGRRVSIGAHEYNFSFSPGHTGSFAADAEGTFHAVWVDNRTGVAQLWTAPMTVTGTVAKNGGGDLAALADLGAKVQLQVINRRHDQRANTIVFTTRLKNTSKDTIRGPVKLRAISIRSDIAVARAANANNGMNGPGAVWDLSALVPAAGLLPDSTTKATDLVFSLSSVRPFRQGTRNRFGILDLSAVILGQAPPKKP